MIARPSRFARALTVFEFSRLASQQNDVRRWPREWHVDPGLPPGVGSLSSQLAHLLTPGCRPGLACFVTRRVDPGLPPGVSLFRH